MNRQTSVETEEPTTEQLAEILAENLLRELHRIAPEAVSEISVESRVGQERPGSDQMPVVGFTPLNDTGRDLMQLIVSSPAHVVTSYHDEGEQGGIKLTWAVIGGADRLLRTVEHLEAMEAL